MYFIPQETMTGQIVTEYLNIEAFLNLKDLTILEAILLRIHQTHQKNGNTRDRKS